MQAHNGEHSEPHNSKLKPTEKEQTHQVFTPCVFALSVCNKGLGLAHKAFVRSNAMLAFSESFQILR